MVAQRREKTCPDCGGNGLRSARDRVAIDLGPCPRCGGSGRDGERSPAERHGVAMTEREREAEQDYMD